MVLKQYLTKTKTLLIVSATLVLVVLSTRAVASASSLRSSGDLTAGHNKILRSIRRHKSRAVCAQAGFGQAHCLSYISLNDNGLPITGTPASSGSFGPTEFHTAYNLPCTPEGSVASVCNAPGSFGPETIAIVDAGNFSTGVSGLDTSLAGYDQYYGLPTCSDTNGCLEVVNQTGSTSSLPADAGWSDEIALDVEVAHMVCQTCKILLVEANDETAYNLAAANVEASSFNPVVISNSWGSDADDSSLDADFKYTGIAEVAATGDTSSVGSSGAAWPADIPQVVAVSGTTLQLNTDNTWAGESVWSGSGGGCSDYYAAPSWQTSLSDWAANGCGAYRAFGDISADGDPNTGAAINVNGTWLEIGGTSLSSPLIAGIFALVGGVKNDVTASSVPYSDFGTLNSHDITTGNDCTTSNELNCTATTGFDEPSGLGSPNGISGFMSLVSKPVGLVAESVNQNEINLSWQVSSGATGYYIYRDNSKIADVTSANYSDIGLTPNSVHDYYIVAHDNSGNLSAASNIISSATGTIGITFGKPTDTPITGDWTGDGTTSVGVRRGNVFYLDYGNGD